jgi:hypothetical protein
MTMPHVEILFSSETDDQQFQTPAKNKPSRFDIRALAVKMFHSNVKPAATPY